MRAFMNEEMSLTCSRNVRAALSRLHVRPRSCDRPAGNARLLLPPGEFVMRKSGFSLLTTLVLGVCALPSAAFAQEAPAAPAAPPPAAAAPAAPPAADAPGVAPATPATQPPAAGDSAPPPAAPPAETAAAPAPPAEAAAPPAPTFPATTITGFIEGGYNHVFGAPHPPDQGAAIPTRRSRGATPRI